MRQIIATMKWGAGYPSRDFNRLFRAVSDICGTEYPFFCITDDPTGLDKSIQTVPLPAIPLDQAFWNRGMWPKVSIFSQDVFEDDAKVLFLDADVAVTGDLAPLFDHLQPGRLDIVKDWKGRSERYLPFSRKKARTGNSSVFAFFPGDQRHLWAHFKESPLEIFKKYRADQIYISELGQGIKYLPSEWCESFKKTTAPLPYFARFSKCDPGPECKIIAFHGDPNIDDLIYSGNWRDKFIMRYGRIGWINDYCEKYG